MDIQSIFTNKFGTSITAQIPLQKEGKSFRATICKEGINVDNLGNSPFLPWECFQAAYDLLIKNKGEAKKGDAMNGKLGDHKLPLNSIEGYIAHVVYGQQLEKAIFRRISPISALLVWVGLCNNSKRGYLTLNKPN